MIDDYPELSNDNSIAFKQLEAEFRKTFAQNADPEDNSWYSEALDYMSQTLAAAKALDISALSMYDTPNEIDPNHYYQFRRDVDSILVQIRVHYSRRAQEMSVGFNAAQKTKIHRCVCKIRKTIEESSVQVAKREKLFEIISMLSKEVDQPRTRFERFTDVARGLAGVSKEFEEEGARPWWKWFHSMMGIVHDAKENEQLQIPQSLEPKLIEAPRKALPKPKPKTNDFDDEIPF